MSTLELTSLDQKVLKKVGKRPKSGTQIAQQLGHRTHHPIAHSLSRLERSGKVTKSDKGYQLAA